MVRRGNRDDSAVVETLLPPFARCLRPNLLERGRILQRICRSCDWGQAGCFRFHRDVLQRRAKVYEERQAVTRRVRMRQNISTEGVQKTQNYSA